MLHTKEVLNTYMAAFCDQPIDKLRRDTDRDFYMTPSEARQYGLIDEVVQHRRVLPDPKIPSLKVNPAQFYVATVWSVPVGHLRCLHRRSLHGWSELLCMPCCVP